MKVTTISVTEFKAKCLALVAQMDKEGGAVTVTKRGRPVAVLSPVRKERLKSPAGLWAGKVKMSDFADIDTADLWDVVRDPSK